MMGHGHEFGSVIGHARCGVLRLLTRRGSAAATSSVELGQLRGGPPPELEDWCQAEVWTSVTWPSRPTALPFALVATSTHDPFTRWITPM